MQPPRDRFIEIRPGIFRTTVLEDSNFATEGINLHFIPDDDGCLLIDTGFPTDASKQSILYTLNERLHIPFEKTRLFITHSHPDHNGLAPWCQEKGMQLFMKGEEYGSARLPRPRRNTSLLNFGGLDAERYFEASMHQELRAKGDHFPEAFDFEDIKEGTLLSRGGGYRFETVSMAGHTLHQQGVMDKNAGILFCADQVILGIVPAVMTSKPNDGLLNMFFNTLDFIRHQDFTYLLPAHGEALYKKDGSIIAALSYIEDSYGKLCSFLLQHLQEDDGRKFTAFELTLILYNEPEEAFYRNLGKRTLMTGKILTCLEFLCDREVIGRKFEGEKALYYV